MQCRAWESHEPHRDCHAKSRPGPRPGSGSTGDSPESQAGARGTEEGTGGESKEEEKEGQPCPCSGKMTGAMSDCAKLQGGAFVITVRKDACQRHIS